MATWDGGHAQADPPRMFRARSGDTMPNMIIPGMPPPAPRQPDGILPPGTGWPAPPRRHRFRTLVRRTLAALVTLVVLVGGGFGVLLLVTPSAGQAEALTQAQLRSHGLGYPGPPVSARFAAALVATEDHRFYTDPGVDPIAVGRVALGYLRGHGSQQGGATITQQLAKMLYTPGRSSLAAEAEQITLAVKLNFTYSKPQILAMYASVAYFGQGYYSLGAASCGYFGVPPSGLTWPQAALLAGAVQAPSAYDPLSHPAQAKARESHVLSRLAATGVLTRAQASAALAQSIQLLPAGQGRPAGCG
ncbi:MAG TPA: biosynthetic peptidoglycan transglycosylase [Streptosporangiaceae bacterium]